MVDERTYTRQSYPKIVIDPATSGMFRFSTLKPLSGRPHSIAEWDRNGKSLITEYFRNAIIELAGQGAGDTRGLIELLKDPASVRFEYKCLPLDGISLSPAQLIADMNTTVAAAPTTPKALVYGICITLACDSLTTAYRRFLIDCGLISSSGIKYSAERAFTSGSSGRYVYVQGSALSPVAQSIITAVLPPPCTPPMDSLTADTVHPNKPLHSAKFAGRLSSPKCRPPPSSSPSSLAAAKQAILQFQHDLRMLHGNDTVSTSFDTAASRLVVTDMCPMVPVSGAGEGTTLDPASGLWEGNAFGAGEGLIPHFGTGEGHSPNFGVGEGQFPASASFAGEGITAPAVSGKGCSLSSDATLPISDCSDFQ